MARGAHGARPEETRRAEIIETLEIGLTSVVLMTRAVVKEMMERKRGTIIHIASDLGRRPLAKMSVYVAAKHGVVGFSQSLARELKEYGVKSMALTPGIIDSHFGGRAEGQIAEPYALKPETIAQTVLWMASQPAHVILDEVSIHATGQDF
ncbi:MAG: SDR family oxidoreductase [Ignavibacteriales bacterium]|nr:SDR family oxidoreductase [Ignavibacteriales bacterium]